MASTHPDENDSYDLMLRAIGDISDEGLFVYNTRTKKFDYANASLSRMWDISHASFSGEPSFYAHHVVNEDMDYLVEKYARLRHARRAENIEFRIKTHDARIRNVSGSFYLIDDGRYIVGFVKDITASKEHENYIVNYGAKKDTLLDWLTHSLTTPLMLSNRMVSALEKAVRERDVKSIEDHFQLIKQNITHCIDFVNEFLEEEHLVSEHIHIKNNRFDVVEKINGVLDGYRKSDSHDFLFDSPVPSLYIINDDVKFFQIVNNLVSNAIKFSEDKTPVEIKLEDHEDLILISVKDEGIGIPDHLKPRLFQRHTPSSRPGIRGEKSIGIGLYIINKLLHLMGGSISFESDENSGSTFVIRLPKDAKAVTVMN